MMTAPAVGAVGYVNLTCPSGAENGPVSHGTHSWWAFPARHRGRRLWLVRVPTHVYRHFCDNGGGFAVADDELQGRLPPE
jgi:hypothetical protein